MTEKRRLPTGPKRKHGGYSYITTGRLPEHRREIEKYLIDVRERLIVDIAGTEENLTAAQELLIGRVIAKLGVVRCIEAHVAETRKIIEGGELVPALGNNYLAFSNSVRLDLVALGVARKAEDGRGVDLSKFIKAVKV